MALLLLCPSRHSGWLSGSGVSRAVRQLSVINVTDSNNRRNSNKSPWPAAPAASPQPRRPIWLSRGSVARDVAPLAVLSQHERASQPPRRLYSGLASKLVDAFPHGIRPYLRLMRIDKPIGTWLLFWPCGWSVAMAAPAGALPDLPLLVLFGAGAIVMRGAGCTINDMWDKDIDAKVERTKNRPLTSGQLNHFDALVFLGGQLGVGLLILLQLNWYSIVLGASSLGLVVLYPVMKRITHWPQLVLGLTINWGALLGWAAVHGSCDWSVCLPLYLAGAAWTLIYDTIYAHQDKFEDAVLGIHSTALHFGDATKQWLAGFATAMVTGLTVAGHQCEQTWPYYASVALIGLHISRQIFSLNIDSQKDCAKKFVSNRHVGLVLFFGILFGTLVKVNSESRGLVSATVAAAAASAAAVPANVRTVP